VAILLVGAACPRAPTETLVGPVTVGLIVAVVASPAVAWLQSHHVGRVAGAGIVVLVILALAVGVLLLVVGGITSQGDAVRSQANHAAPRIQDWLTDLGVGSNGARSVTDSVQAATRVRSRRWYTASSTGSQDLPRSPSEPRSPSSRSSSC
jgi:predicted PurR-regulated permease PerM